MLSVTLALMTVLSLIAVTITTQTVSQLGLSSNVTNRNSALEGALSGVQAAVADIRAASSGGDTVTTELPCTTVSGLTNTSGSSSFIASIQYQDETSQGTYTSVTCTQGQGPASPASGSFLARAVITSCSPATACPTNPTSAPGAGATWRRVVSTYDFNTSYANIPGGLVYSYSGKECLYANYTNGNNPNGGVTLQVTTTCSSSNIHELFQYTTNWNLAIELGGTNYCVQDPEDSSPASTSPLTLTTNCTSTAVAQWGVNDFGGIGGVSTSSAGQPNGWCLGNPDSSDATLSSPENATVEDTDCESSPSNSESMDNTSTWQLSSAVGAGASQPQTGDFGITDQLVNFQEFGYCLDVTGQNVNSSYLIDYMCKQFPDTAEYPAWNQRWCFNQLSTNSSGLPVGVLYTPEGQTSCSSPTSPYCLTSPLATPGTLPSTVFVTVTACTPTSSTQANDLLWTQWGDSTLAGSIHDYTYTDNDGYCLEANTANKMEPSSDYFSTIQVDTCNGSFEQKWNAPPLLGTSQIVNTHEDTGSGSYSGS